MDSRSSSSHHPPPDPNNPANWASLQAVGCGFRDSILGIRALFSREQHRKTPERGAGHRRHEDVTLNRIYKCCLLNGGVFGASVFLFEYALIPGLQAAISFFLGSDVGLTSRVWFWLRPLLSYTFGGLWILPLFCLSRIINVFWFQDVANAQFRGRSRPQQFPTLIADTFYSLVIEALFLLQATLVLLLPISYIGSLISLVCMSILYALYSFEYKWFNAGWATPQRLSFIENNWTYFLGFGLPLAVITFLSSSPIINGVLFSVLFPFFIVSANEAKVARGLCDHPLPFFKLTIWLTDALTKVVFRR